MPIEYIIEDNLIEALVINGQRYSCEEDNKFIIPKYALKKIKVSDLKDEIAIDICDDIQEGTIFLSTDAITINKIDEDKCKVFFESSGRRKYWDGSVGFKLYMETKKEIISERQKEIKDISLESYDDDGDYIFLHYSCIVIADSMELVIKQAEQIVKEIEGAVDLTLGSPFKNIDDAMNETDFTISLIIPLIRKLGFSNVRYNHGRREYGKDIIFTRKTEFDEFEYWGAQVKFGDISGGVNSEIDELIGQAEDAFKMPFYDLYTRSRQRISKLLIVISGKFKENAVEKICEKIENHALKNNIIFVDGEKIKTLSERFRQ